MVMASIWFLVRGRYNRKVGIAYLSTMAVAIKILKLIDNAGEDATFPWIRRARVGRAHYSHYTRIKCQ